jgi:hypothetical protein
VSAIAGDIVGDLLRARDPAQRQAAAERYREVVLALTTQGRSRDEVMRHAALTAGLRPLLEAFEALALDDVRENATIKETFDVAVLRRCQQRNALRRPWSVAVRELALAASEQVPEARPAAERVRQVLACLDDAATT